MRTLIEQLESSVGMRLYYLSLFTALTVPDIAGALDAVDGQATGARYADWFEKWVRPVFGHRALSQVPDDIRAALPPIENPLTGDACYRFRCSLLHQGRSQHPKSGYSRLLFVEPGASSSVIHGCIANDALVIDLPEFCREVVIGTRHWLGEVERTPRFEANYARFAKRHPAGLAP
jgi:hypothetical protein